MKFNKKQIYTCKDCEGRIFFNYLDGEFAFTKWYKDIKKKDAEKDFIASVQPLVESWEKSTHDNENFKIKQTYKGDGEVTIVDLAVALRALSGYVLSIGLARECLLEGITQQTNFNYFDVIKE